MISLLHNHGLQIYVHSEKRTLASDELNLVSQLHMIEKKAYHSAKVRTGLKSSPKGGRKRIVFDLQEARNLRSMNFSWNRIASILSEKGERVSPSTIRRGLSGTENGEGLE